MKKLITLIFAVILSLSAFSQQVYTLVDSVVSSDQKLQYSITQLAGTETRAGFLGRLVDIASNQNQNNPGNLSDVPYIQQAKVFYDAVTLALSNYIKSMTFADTTVYIEYPSTYIMQGTGQLHGQQFGYDFYLSGDTLQSGIIKQFDEQQLKIDDINNTEGWSLSDKSKYSAGFEIEKSRLVKIYQRIMAYRN